ncbi:MAG: CapA family protein [Candidatus Saccharibacteria bacterium]|nr:CapA family protein [Candidatus Saccharibacteria bacterium]
MPIYSRTNKTQKPIKKNNYGMVQKRRFGIVFICIVVIGLAFLGYRKTSTPQGQTNQKKQANIQKKYIRILASGDTIAHDALNAQARKTDGSYDYYQFMKPMQPFFDIADIKFCNQAVPGGGEKFGISGYPVFNSPLDVARDLNKLGCNVVNTGTNHTFDRGQAVIDAELNYWDTLPRMLAVAGANRIQAEQDNIRYFTVRGVRFAFLSYSTYTNTPPTTPYGLNVYNDAKAESQVRTARLAADIVMVSMRWGTEYSSSINDQQSQISQHLSDWGADIILGHGPHVLQPVKTLKGSDGRQTICWYSLGNFLNAQIPIESLANGLAIMDVDIATKKLKAPEYVPIYMHYEWTADEKTREDLLKRKNFSLVPLDSAASLLKKSQNNTTVETQTIRIQKTLNQFTTVPLISLSDLQKL